MYHHQFVDPSTINYSDLSLMGSSSSNNDSHDHQQQGPCGFDADPSLFRMLTPSINFHHDANFLNESMFYDPTMNIRLDLGNKGCNLVRDVYHSVVNNYGSGVNGGGGLLGFDHEGGYTSVNGQLINDENMIVLGSNKRKKKVEVVVGTKNEKQRRERLSKKYDVLKELIPNPTKQDRASIVADTITYIQELMRTVDELKMLVEKKRRRKSGIKNEDMTTAIIDQDVAGDTESSCMKPLHGFNKGPLRSSWLQRKSKETHVDVRIVEDEVFIKLSQHKKVDCLMVVARVLDELELELIHMNGGNIGDLHVFMFNTKIHEGSSVYAGGIAKKIIEAMDAKYQQVFVSF